MLLDLNILFLVNKTSSRKAKDPMCEDWFIFIKNIQIFINFKGKQKLGFKNL